MSSVTLVRSLVASAVFLAPLVTSSRAYACTYAIVVMESTYPQAGAVNVPTNAVPFVYGPELNSADDVALIDAEGNVVPTDVRAVEPSGMDLVPQSDLSPNHKYTLRAVNSTDPTASVEFTTGTGPAAVPVNVERPTLDVRVFTYGFASCGEQAGLCIETQSSADTTVEVRIGDEVLRPGAGAPAPQYRAYGQTLALNDCVEVRARDVRGNRSEPAVACGDALSRVQLSGDIPDSGYTCDNYADFVESSPDGCALGRKAAASSGVWWLVVGVVVCAAARRRAYT